MGVLILGMNGDMMSLASVSRHHQQVRTGTIIVAVL
jgi:ribose/xylose/arabinose/galactoside ABC-type transport system permease subunit